MTADPLRDSRRRADEPTAAAERIYAALKNTGALKSHRLLSYRCPRRCLLLEVVRLPDPVGLLLHVTPYRLSPGMNEASSNEDGRAHNTVDGDNHWKGWTGPRDLASNPTLTCKHLRVVLPDADLEADIRSGHAALVLLPSGERRPG